MKDEIGIRNRKCKFSSVVFTVVYSLKMKKESFWVLVWNGYCKGRDCKCDIHRCDRILFTMKNGLQHLKTPVPEMNGNLSVSKTQTVYCAHSAYQVAGFRFVRYFLLVILCVVGSMMTVLLLLGWNLGMDVTIEGSGRIEPQKKYEIKSRRSGLVDKVFVRQGQLVNDGDLLMSLDDTDLINELDQLDQEMAINESQQRSFIEEFQRERAVLETDVSRAIGNYEMVCLELEKLYKEYQVYHKYVPFRGNDSLRSPIDALMPVRLQKSRVQNAKIEIERSQRRLIALDSRKEELTTLKQMYGKLQAKACLLKSHMEKMKIYAPVAGTVLTRDLEKRIGDHLVAGESIVELAELDDWQAQVMVQEIDFPKIKVGQDVKLYVNAFPHMAFKVFEGQVKDVSRKPESIGSNSVQSGFNSSVMPSTIYPVKVWLKNTHVTDGENVYSLAYGMGVDVKIVTERGPVIDIVWKKLLKAVGKIGRPEIYHLENSKSDLTAINRVFQ